MKDLDSLEEKLEQMDRNSTEMSDVGIAMNNLFPDTNNIKRQKDINTRTRLSALQVEGMSKCEFLEKFNIKLNSGETITLFEGLTPLTLSMKEHLVSLHGAGRTETVDLFKSKTEEQSNRGFMSKLTGFFAPRK